MPNFFKERKFKIFLLIAILFLFFSVGFTVSAASCSLNGDLDANGRIEEADFDFFKTEFLQGRMMLSCFEYWRRSMFGFGIPTVTPTPDSTRIGDPINKKVYVLKFEPIMSNGQTLTQYMGWRPYGEYVQEAIDWFKGASDNRVNFSVAFEKEVNGWPTKEDGFIYDEQSYLDVISGRIEPHRPDTANYYEFLNNQDYDICGKLNRGEIDELWLMGRSWFGFWESAMASSPNGPPGFWVNGPTYRETACNKLLPVGLPGGHTFGHRAEATMTYVYGGWEENRMAHNWDRFGLVRALSPDFSVFGCGSVHYSHNSRTLEDDYDFDIRDEVPTYCDIFYNYPSIPQTEEDLRGVAQPIGCAAWGCTANGYEQWWWKHLPKYKGVGPDGKLNDWWQYIFDPNIALGAQENRLPDYAIPWDMFREHE